MKIFRAAATFTFTNRKRKKLILPEKWFSIRKAFAQKHKNNGKIIREKKIKTIHKCSCCDFIAPHNDCLKNHYLSKHASINEKENEFTFYCKLCDFGTYYENVYNKHCKFKKHIMAIKYLDNEINKIQADLSSKC